MAPRTRKIVAVSGHNVIGLEVAAGMEGRHFFGGELGLRVSGMHGKAPPLQRLLTIDLRDGVFDSLDWSLPHLALVYGFRMDECRVIYRLTSETQMELRSIEPDEPADNWPYADYPSAFPTAEVITCRATRRDVSRVDPEGIFDRAKHPGHLVVVVPPITTFPCSLWGPDGDSVGVEVVFDVNLESMSIEAFNQCD